MPDEMPDEPTDNAPVIMGFDGLLIGSSKKSGVYQMGVVPAAEHQFSITVTEFQKETISGQEVLSRIRSQEFGFSDFPLVKKEWKFRIINNTGPAPAAAAGYTPGRKPQRIGGTPTPQEKKRPPMATRSP